MWVVTVASRKGGSGKTTLAGHLAVQAERSGGGPVAIVDLDPQGSLSEWWNQRSSELPRFLQTDLVRIIDDVEELRQSGFKLIIIDTPPALGPTIERVVAISDLVLVPVRPSPHDLRSVGATVELVEHLGKPLVFALNAATPRARITAEAIDALSQHGPLVPVVIHQRVDYASSMIDGRTAMELPGASRALAEMAGLWSFLEARLSGRPFRPVLPLAVGLEEPMPRVVGASSSAE
jgi:chromosome partitioning protein